MTRTPVLAMLVAIFEQTGSRYAVAMRETYIKLKESYIDDLRQGPNPEANVAKAERLFRQKNIETSSEIWEVLGLQMLERGEMALSAEFFLQVP
jgi:hypothetical protein